MKLIRYNGGIVSFKLPADWKEEYYDEGGAAFYRDAPDSGTLRVSVISFQLKEDAERSTTLASESGLYVEEGFPLKEEIKYSNENNEDILLYFWEVLVPVEDGSSRRIILFSYTILASQENDPLIMQEVNFVRNTILTAHYSQEKGVLPK